MKKVILSLSLLVLFALSSFATTTPETTSNSATVTEIFKAVKKLNLDITKMDSENVTLKFMMNDNNEIVVLSTQDSSVDGALKSTLNYRSIKNNDLIPYKVYLLPIRFES